MENVSYCPYRTSVNWANVQTTPFTKPVTFSGEVQVTQFTPPVTFTGTSKDLEFMESCKDKPDLAKGKFCGANVWCKIDNGIVPAGATAQYLDPDQSEEEEANIESNESPIDGGGDEETKPEDDSAEHDNGGGEGENIEGNAESNIESDDTKPSGDSDTSPVVPAIPDPPIESEKSEPPNDSGEAVQPPSDVVSAISPETTGEDLKSAASPAESPKEESGMYGK